MTAAVIVDDLRSLDPVSYIQTLGLRPEDSYGFMPASLSEMSPLVYVYRDSPDYEKARADLPAPTESRSLGMTQGGPGQPNMFMVEGDRSMDMSQLVQQSMQMAAAWGAQGVPGASAAAPAAPDPAKLERIEKLKQEGAINDEEYERLRAEAGDGASGSAAPAPASKASEKAAPIVVHRIYPGLHLRMKKRQLNKFMPDYHQALGLRPEDVYGVFPREITAASTGGPDSTSVTQWDDYWIVYRDRPEYAAGREAWAKEMNKKGKWPEPMTAPGVSEAPDLAADESDVEVKEEKQPKHAEELGKSLVEKIEDRGYTAEDSFGFAPSFSNYEVYFAWRKS